MYGATLTLPCDRGSRSCWGGDFTVLPGVQNAPTYVTLSSCPAPLVVYGTTHPKPQVADRLLHCGYGGYVRARRDGTAYPGSARRQLVQQSVARTAAAAVPVASYVATSTVALTAGDYVGNGGTGGQPYSLTAVTGTVNPTTINSAKAWDFDGTAALGSAPFQAISAAMTLVAVIRTDGAAPATPTTIVGGRYASELALVQSGYTLTLEANGLATPAQVVGLSTVYVIVGTVDPFGQLNLSINGAVPTFVKPTGRPRPTLMTAVHVGSDAAGGQLWTGAVAEVALYPEQLVDQALEDLLDGLATTYAA